MSDCEQIYALARWGEGYFRINSDGHLCIKPNPDAGTEIDLARLAEQVQEEGLSLPVLVRFNDVLRHRVRALCKAFDTARTDLGYRGHYTPVYPIKVNQQRSVLEQIQRDGLTGLEAGSKPELMAVIALSAPGGLVVCNGYKDREYLRTALIGRRLGLRLFIVVEKPSELPVLLEEAERIGVEPLIGVRVRLAAEAVGKWQSSGGEKAKFGLNPAQVLQLVDDLKAVGKLHWLKLLHAHLGSQIPNLGDIQKGLKELVRYYAELYRLDARLEVVDVGGGLGIDYEGTKSRDFCSINYNLLTYAKTVTSALQQLCAETGLPEPDIFTESGRAMTAHHAVLIANVTDREDASTVDIPAEVNGEVLHSMIGNLGSLDQMPPLEVFETAGELLREARSDFERGALDLQGRAHAERIFLATCRELQARLTDDSRRQRELRDRINALLAEKLFCNFSLFQSMPDIWGIDQIFPIVPLQRLDSTPDIRAVLHDLTCDSDGCIKHYVDRDGIEASLPVHRQKAGEQYPLGFFLLGAYQEILGDIHNLFGDTDTVNIELDGDGYRLLEPERGDSVDELLSYVHFEPRAMMSEYRRKLNAAGLDARERERLFVELKSGLYGYTYLESD